MPTENIITCESIFPLLSVYVDGEATPDEAFRVERHRDTCKVCASHLAFLRATSFVLTGMPEPVPDSALFARIASATYAKPSLREQIAEKVGFWLRPLPVRYALGSAVAVALAAIVVVPRFAAQQSPLATLPPVGAGDASPSVAREISPVEIGTPKDIAGSSVGNNGVANGSASDPALLNNNPVAVKKTAPNTVKPRVTSGGAQVAVNKAAEEARNKKAAEEARNKKAADDRAAKAARRTAIAVASAKTGNGGKSLKTASTPKSTAASLAPRSNITKTPQIASITPAELRRSADLFRPQVQLPSRQAAAPRESVGESRIATLPENTGIVPVAGANMTKPAPDTSNAVNTSVALAAPTSVRTARGFRVQGGGSGKTGMRTHILNIAASAKEQVQGTNGLVSIVSSPID